MQVKTVAMPEKTKVMLVTGGAGFIGSEFIRYIFQKHPDYQIINLDKLTYAGDLYRLIKIADLPNYTFVDGDITDAGFVTRLFNQYDFDYVVNFAAETHVTRSIFNPAPFMHTNVEGVRTLLNAALLTWDNLAEKKFLHISTDEVYGSLEKDADHFFTEEMLPCPRSPYSSSKAEADLVAQSYFSTHNLPVLITRSTNNYGPWQHPEKLVPLVVSNALENKPIPIHGDGSDIRDWLYVGDHCVAIDTVLHYGSLGEIYNIGSNNEVETIHVVKTILDRLSKPYSLIRHIPFRENHDMRYAIDASKIKGLKYPNGSHWEPTVAFNDGMRFTIEWYRDSLGWLRKLRSTSDFRNYYQKLVAGTEAEEIEEIIVSQDEYDYAFESPSP
ncbi:dTDP-glucose 4,6-dehydratase [Candidatus Termititenax persephonae]|uniref:dTDP-glucose 4,6-dehydratase n=1 Tax=Candidatus Termititenax persephonae TaxID=2218525 RepID=A0A388TIK6_9BACT|nr:dTDP-glucose 4,6-dehydratase [Candidatus Termititenax persephonae]